ncbi:MAG: hypothetical protein S4CHLAM2_16730 [Chlamydiales bacterium]|nr:hypothetical protein [Chlamydiales bacterium]
MKKIILLITLAVFVLLGGAYLYLGIEKREAKGWLPKGEVRGSALIVEGLPYTLSYQQQLDVVHQLNHAKLIDSPPKTLYTGSPIEWIELYAFNTEQPLVATPLSNDFAYFKIRSGKQTLYLQLKQPQDLHTILEMAYDL